MLDIILIVFFGLFIVYGCFKGFGRMLVSMLGFFLTLLLVYFLTKPFASFLNDILPFDRWINTPIIDWLGGLHPVMNEVVPQEKEQLISVMTQSGIPFFIANLISPLIMPYIPDVAQGTTAAQAIGPGIGAIAMLAIAAIILFILLRIAIYVIQRITKVLTAKGGFGLIDKVLGMALGFVKAYLYVALIFGLIAALSVFSFMSPIKAQLQNSSISKWFYDNNFIAEWILGDIELEDKTSDAESASCLREGVSDEWRENTFEKDVSFKNPTTFDKYFETLRQNNLRVVYNNT